MDKSIPPQAGRYQPGDRGIFEEGISKSMVNGHFNGQWSIVSSKSQVDSS